MNWRDELTSEKGLMDVYLVARKFSSTKSNFYFSLFMGFSFCIILILDRFFQVGIYYPDKMSDAFEKILSLGFSLSIAILGFLIAGFSIFATITRTKILIVLAKIPTKGNVSRLKFIFYNFMFVFIHYLGFLTYSIFCIIFSDKMSKFFLFLNFSFSAPIIIYWVFSVLIVCLSLSWLSFLLMLLKSFIWNILQSILLTITADGLIPKNIEDSDIVK